MVLNTHSFDGDSVIVTGGSSGIGRTVAEQFVRDGANVTICSRTAEDVKAVVDEFESADYPGSAMGQACDVADREAVADLVSATVDAYGTVDHLVNNAGASFMAPFDELSEEGWRRIIEINLHGTYNCSQEVGKVMRADNGGTTVNVSSNAATLGSPLMTHYGAAKAGIENLTRSLCFEWASDGIRVNCVAPGLVATSGLAGQMDMEADEIDRTETERRIGTKAEIGDTIQFLASPQSSFINGETIRVRGIPDVEKRHDFGKPYSWM
jgi:NAD(P)-dependent dehydrogenase (short-subunit alcohol dehydrogenase family)